MQTEVNLESPNLLLTKNSVAAPCTIVVTLGDIILKVALFLIMCSLISTLVTGISMVATGWFLSDLGLE
ncbi:MAG: hypothetical protein ND895_22530 [Pyrinomonadaceae bacterium]|nr:hypothetical protein [Pyrinomonadaceae bacterium]